MLRLGRRCGLLGGIIVGDMSKCEKGKSRRVVMYIRKQASGFESEIVNSVSLTADYLVTCGGYSLEGRCLSLVLLLSSTASCRRVHCDECHLRHICCPRVADGCWSLDRLCSC